MKRVLIGAVAALALMTSISAGQPAAPAADILSVIPQSSLAAVIVRNPEAAADHLFKMIVPLGAPAPEEGEGKALEALLKEMHLLGHAPEGEGKSPIPASIDRKGPMAFVLVAPAFDVPGEPIALIFKVTDYKQFLQDVAKEQGAAAPEVTADGTDVIKGDKDSTFCAQLGAFAVVAPAEYVIRTVKVDAKDSLAAGGVPAMRKLAEANDVAAYANIDLVMKTFRPQINMMKAMMKQQFGRAQNPGMGVNGEQMGQFFNAYIETLVTLAGEMDALCAGVKFSQTGATGSMVVQPLPETSLARLCAGFRPAQSDLLARFDAPFVMAGSWDLPPAVMDEVAKVLDGFVARIEVPEGEENKLKQLIEIYRTMVAGVSGPGGFVWHPVEGGPLFRITEVIGVKPNSDLLAATRDYLSRGIGMMGGAAMPFKVDSTYDQKIETYRQLPISRMSVKFSLAPEKADDMQSQMALKMIKTMYGEEMMTYVAQMKDTLVLTLGEPDTKALKGAVDRMLDGKKGDLQGSPAFVEAVSALPPGRSALLALSMENLMLVMPKMVPMMDMGGGLAGIKFDKLSAVGMSVNPLKDGLAVNVNVPMQEMLNLKHVFETMNKANAQPVPPAAEKEEDKGDEKVEIK